MIAVTLPVGSKFTPRSTPYHINELVLQLIRYTFNGVDHPDFPFRWTDDFATTKIIIGTNYNPEVGIEGVKPQIIISHGDAGSQSIATGDLASKSLENCAATKTSIVQSSCMAKVVAKRKTDVDILANEVFNFFLACRPYLPQLTSIQNIQNISMTQVVPFGQDDNLYQSIVSIVFQMQYKWMHIVSNEVIEGYVLYLNGDKKIDK